MVTSEIKIADTVEGPIPPRVDSDDWPGVIHTRIQDIVIARGPAPWSVSLIWDERNNATLIANDPGTGNIPHWHKDFDEWWIVMRGTLQWEYTGGRVVRANEGDVVWVPRGSVHHIQNVGDGLSLRLAVSMPPAEHYASPCGVCDYAPEVDPIFGISEVIAALRPRVMAIEELYAHVSRPRTSILMGHARGVLCLAGAQAGIPVVHYSATQIKKILTGSGRAPKVQIPQAIQRELSLAEPPEPNDVADALAIAVCHYYLNRGVGKIGLHKAATAGRAALRGQRVD